MCEGHMYRFILIILSQYDNLLGFKNHIVMNINFIRNNRLRGNHISLTVVNFNGQVLFKICVNIFFAAIVSMFKISLL